MIVLNMIIIYCHICTYNIMYIIIASSGERVKICLGFESKGIIKEMYNIIFIITAIIITIILFEGSKNEAL